MSAPDRIWHAIDRNGKISGCPDAHVMPCSDVQEAYTEYVRAYLCAPQDARVQALEAENARLRGMLASIESAPRHAKLADHDLVEWMADTARAALRDLEQGEG